MSEPTYRIAQALHARRAAVGLPKYGQHLTADSPGCMLVHALEESADKTNYLIAEVQRRKIVLETLNELSKEMHAELAIGWAYKIEKLYDLLGGKSAIEQYDKILGGGTVAENATVAPEPTDAAKVDPRKIIAEAIADLSAPDPRDEALRVAEEALEYCRKEFWGMSKREATDSWLGHVAGQAEDKVRAALAAIRGAR